MDAVKRQFLHFDDIPAGRNDDLDAFLLNLGDRIDRALRDLAAFMGKQCPVDIKEDDLDILRILIHFFDMEKIGKTRHLQDIINIVIDIDDRESTPVCDLLLYREKTPQSGRRDVFGLAHIDDQVRILIHCIEKYLSEFFGI